MKALYIAASLSPEWGGPVKVIQGLTEALAKKGIEVSIFAPIKRGKEKEAILPKGVNIRLFPQDIFAKFWRNHSFALNRGLEKEISNFDLIHIHEIWHHSHFVAYRLARKFNKPYVISIHGALEPWCVSYKAFKKRIFSSLFEIQILKQASTLHAITQEELKHIRALGVDNRIVVIPNGVDPQEFQQLPSRKDLEGLYPELKGKKVILFLGRIHPIKGLDILVKAFARVTKERADVRLVIAGPNSDDYQAKIELMLKSQGVLNKTIFTGMLTGREKLAVLSRADIFVLPSYSEGFSMAILEAMICELPVIITHQCQFPEVAEARAGLVIDPDSNQLAEALAKLLDDPMLCAEMGANGRQLILEKYSWDKIADQMIQLYEDVLGSRMGH